jgi:hypothetical protein
MLEHARYALLGLLVTHNDHLVATKLGSIARLPLEKSFLLSCAALTK